MTNNIKIFTIEKNKFLSKNINAYYHYEYIKYKEFNNPDFLVTLKNNYNYSDYRTKQHLKEAMIKVKECIGELLTFIESKHKEQILVCVVPRSLIQTNNNKMQFCFKQAVKESIKEFNISKNIFNEKNKFIDATNCIMRHTKTKRTHLKSIDDTGLMPYIGITKDTCNICNSVNNKLVLLIDDIYTKTINIDEDCIQALYDKGVKNVVFYSVAKTINKQCNI